MRLSISGPIPNRRPIFVFAGKAAAALFVAYEMHSAESVDAANYPSDEGGHVEVQVMLTWYNKSDRFFNSELGSEAIPFPRRWRRRRRRAHSKYQLRKMQPLHDHVRSMHIIHNMGLA